VKVRRWSWLLVPALGLLEWGAHAYFAGRPPTAQEWDELPAQVTKWVAADTLVVVAPSWAEPHARRVLGDRVMPLSAVARPDESRYVEAVEISILGAESEVSAWTELKAERSGKFQLRLLRNPQPVPVLVDFVARVQSGAATVVSTRAKEAADCAWTTNARVENGALHGHPTFPKQRFVCPGEAWHMVGATVIEDQNYRPRQCIWAQPGEGRKTSITFDAVLLGQSITGYGALPYFLERESKGTPVELDVLVDGERLGRFRHEDGEGWKKFEFSTARYSGGTHAVEFRVSSKRSRAREFCFQAAVR
jgi:hypothetical protein